MLNAMNATSLTLPHSSLSNKIALISLKKFIQTQFGPALDGITITDPQTAHLICRLIPAQCPFERDVKIKGHLLFHIPAMCKLNPLFDQLIDLRFRALTFLADHCGEDVTRYCQ